MSFLQVNFSSKTLNRNVTFNALIPIDTIEISGQAKIEKKPMKALYLLHGLTQNYSSWVCSSRIQELSITHNIAVFMPSGENNFYVDDDDKGELFGEFIGNDLIEFTRSIFPISKKREDTFIGGLSMGGYGAIRNGLKYSENFSRIIALSSALITYNIAGVSTDYKDEIGDYKYYTRLFGELPKLQGSDKDPEALIINLKKRNSSIPKIYMACGTEDSLLEVNHRYRDFLISEKIGATYVESSGGHTWDFWNEYIEKSIIWALD
ncbi:acetylesterase [Clostridium algoriphilum]|uniref:alpha/beta hydrolase n=1 Tax=Clostridium algoriphilum TaxID=198347 RepID=UPI001CF31838|nr:alpha/beta hydrolase-fold protein [Clostridium algoriphilum]MCB2294098.1 acetylesterase [Clostridium algoriphilum]